MAKKQGFLISLSTPALILFIGISFVAMYLSFPTFLPMVLFSGFGIIACIIFLFWWATGSLRLDLPEGQQPTNATLTCKNGHTGRVWVKLGIWDRWELIDEQAIIYNIEGYEVRRSPKIIPECCPECGAEWRVPDKRKSHK